MEQAIEFDQMLSLRQLEEVVGLRKTANYGAIKSDDFPRPLKLTPRTSAWLRSGVQAWMKTKREERDAPPSSPGMTAWQPIRQVHCHRCRAHGGALKALDRAC